MDAVKPLVNQIRQEICTSQTVHFDETSYPVNGDTGWVWVATRQICFVTVENSRGVSVLQKYFGTFHGIAVSDGWRAYRIFCILQRCWAHILREARHLAVRTKSETAVNLYDALCKLFSDAKSGLKDSPAPNRLPYQEMMHRLEKDDFNIRNRLAA
jgi:hypothetical protein